MASVNPAPLASVAAITTAQRMLDAAICAYSVGPGGYVATPFYDGSVGWSGTPVGIPDGPDAIDAALVGKTDDNWAVLSLRGTLPSYDSFATFVAFIEDWLQDDETALVPMVTPNGTAFGNVHQGFLAATMALWTDVSNQLQSVDLPSLEGLRITGHSKGAAMAFLFAALVSAEMGAAGPKAIEVYGFATPLVGDPAFAAAYSDPARGLSATTRYQCAHDLVPFLPPYTTFDLFDWISFWHIRFDLELDAVLLYLAETVTTGYELVGSLEYYPAGTPDDPFPDPLTGDAAQWQAQADILAAIQAGAKNTIAAAHSATMSYWPAVFQQNPPMLPLGPTAAAYLAAFQAGAQAISAVD